MLTPATNSNVSVTVDERESKALLDAIEQTLMGHNLYQYLRDHMQPYVRLRTAHRFRAEGDDASGPWAPLMAATQQIREHAGFPPMHPINRRTGELENFLLRGVIDQSWTPDSAIMRYPGTPPTHALREKLKTAQQGRARPRTVPRPVVKANAADMSYFTNNFLFWFGRDVQKKFRGGRA